MVKDLVVRILLDDAELDKFNTAGSKAEKFGMVTAKGAAVGAGALVVLGAAAANAAGDAAQLELANDQLAASMGLTETQSANLADAVSGAYEGAFGESREAVESAAQGIVTSIAGMRDASVEQLQGITEKVLTISDGFEIEADRISQVVGQMISSGLAESAEEGLDLLTVALQRVPAAVRADVLDAVDEYGPFFTSIGMSGEAAMSALVAASEKGMYGIDKTGDAVKEFSIRATDMSSASVAAYEAAGLSAEDMAAKIIAGGEQGREGFRQVVDGLLAIQDPVERANAAIGLFGTPLEDLGVNEIPQFLESLGSMAGGLGDVDGAAQRMADTAGGNVATTWEGLTRKFEGVSAELGESLLPVLEAVVDGLDGFADFAAENEGLIAAIAGGVALFATALLAAHAAVTVFTAVQTLQTAAQWASNAAWLANPVTWIVLAIVAAIAVLVGVVWLLWSNWDNITKWMGEALINLGVVVHTVLGEVGNWWNDFLGFIGDGAGWIGDRVGDIVGFFTSIPDRIGEAWNGLIDLVAGVMIAVMNFTIDAWNNTLGGLSFDLPWFVGGGHIEFPTLQNIPALADGGVATSPTLAWIGDGGEPEAVVPLSRANDYGFGGGDGMTHVVLQLDRRTLYEAYVKEERSRR